jgi:transposase-like protein
VSKLDLTLEPERRTIRRLEVITGTGRRRRWSEDDKARIVEETLAPGAVVSQVARRHGFGEAARSEARTGCARPWRLGRVCTLAREILQ